MATLGDFDFFPLHYDDNGKLKDAGEFDALAQKLKSTPGAEVVLIAHGFRNSEDDATGLYTRFLTNFQTQRRGSFAPRLGGRIFLIGGVFWPSKPFREEDDGKTESLDESTAQKEAARAQIESLRTEATTPQQLSDLDRAAELLDSVEDSRDAQDEFADRIRSVFAGMPPDPTEGDGKFLAMSGSEMMDRLGVAPIVVPTERRNDDEGGVQSVGGFSPAGMDADAEGGAQGIGSFFQSMFGRIGHFLNLSLWYVMKNRAGVVGATGVAETIRSLKSLQPAPKVHLVGHSLGGRLMGSCVHALAQDPVVHVDSLSLLEAAFSHYGFSADNGHNMAGGYRDVVVKKVVTGPFFCTFSVKDTVVGHVYAVASRLAGQNVEAIGDQDDQYGGIGRNGAQKTDDVAMKTDLLPDGSKEYKFTPGKIWSLDGSNGLIQDHGDVTNPAVTFAFSCAVSQA